MKKLHALSIFGTSSDAGKSTLAFALTYILHKRGIRVAPFKAQNVSNNAMITDEDHGEIAIPQAFAAEAIGLPTHSDFNPVLLKSGSNATAHIIINGKSLKNESVWEYYRNIDKLKPVVRDAFRRLEERFECIVAEGAGSPVELNLMEKDLANIYVAKKFNTKIILVADIERGGVFASIYGVKNLLPKKLRKNIIGVVINKFRGDMSLFDAGKAIIEERFKLPVLGVIPYRPFNLGFEDSASLINYQQHKSNPCLQIAVIHLPYMANFTDFEPLIADPQIELHFVRSALEASHYDLVILPGSKRVFSDLAWLQDQGFFPLLKDQSQKIIGICGGYEMLFETLYDPFGVESDTVQMQGIGRLKGSVTFAKEKICNKGTYNLFGIIAKGYEIHYGTTKKKAKKAKNLHATFVHGLFESDALRYYFFHAINPAYSGYDFAAYKKNTIANYAKHIEDHLDCDTILEALHAPQ